MICFLNYFIYFCFCNKNIDFKLKKIGNILYTKELVNHKKVDFVNYYNDVLINNINNDLPTLIVGWENVKLNNLNNVSILEKTIIDKHLYWEFQFEEYKQKHVDGVFNFVRLLPDYYFRKRYEYNVIDPIFFKINHVDDILVKIIKKPVEKAYLNNNSLYLLSANNIYNINLNTMKFFYYDYNRVVNFFKERIDYFIDDVDNSIFDKYYKYFKGYKYTKRFLISLI